MRPSQIRNLIVLAVLAVLALWASSTAADFVIEYNWWREIGQVDTWVGMLWYSIAPVTVGAVIAAVILWIAHARGLHFAGVRVRDYPFYRWVITVLLAIVGILLSSATIDYWTVMRYVG